MWRRGGAAFSCSAGWRPAGSGDWRLWREQRWGAQEAQGAQETQEAQEIQEAQEAAAEMQDMEMCDTEAADIMGDYFENVVHQDLERSTNMFRNI